MLNNSLCFPVKKTIDHAIIKTIIVLIATAKFEFMLSSPILAKIAVNAAKKAAKRANKIHIMLFCFYVRVLSIVESAEREAACIKLNYNQYDYNKVTIINYIECI